MLRFKNVRLIGDDPYIKAEFRDAYEFFVRAHPVLKRKPIFVSFSKSSTRKLTPDARVCDCRAYTVHQRGIIFVVRKDFYRYTEEVLMTFFHELIHLRESFYVNPPRCDSNVSWEHRPEEARAETEGAKWYARFCAHRFNKLMRSRQNIPHSIRARITLSN